MQALATLALLTVVPVLLRTRATIRNTSLMSAWAWSLAGVSMWTAASIATLLPGLIPPGLQDYLWYAVSLVMLCPPVAVLGARRPTTRVWNVFVLIPLLLVFAWPVFVAGATGQLGTGFRIEVPLAIGYAFVLLMGAGNYLGTRFTVPTLLYAAALVLLLISQAEAVPSWMPRDPSIRAAAGLTLAGAVWLAWLRTPRIDPDRNSFDGLWIDFRDWFGIVWARRVQDRVNEAARSGKWPIRLEVDGFVPTAENGEASPSRQTEARLEHTLRWLLRRFVDSDWIDHRLGRGGSQPASTKP